MNRRVVARSSCRVHSVNAAAIRSDRYSAKGFYLAPYAAPRMKGISASHALAERRNSAVSFVSLPFLTGPEWASRARHSNPLFRRIFVRLLQPFVMEKWRASSGPDRANSLTDIYRRLPSQRRKAAWTASGARSSRLARVHLKVGRDSHSPG